ncbi:MAG: hypothetical protein AABX55_01635 [Nanoarchaeota archaeon]
MEENREELIKKYGTREDGKFQLYNSEELEKLMLAENNKENWYCLGRQRKEDYVSYCIHAYHDSDKQPKQGCPADCKFYKELHK